MEVDSRKRKYWKHRSWISIGTTCRLRHHCRIPTRLRAASLKKNGFTIAAIPPRYKSTYFSHIWSGGYAANYYSYTWAEILDDDAFAYIEDHGGLSRANGQRFRDLVLAPGYTTDPMSLYRNFRGGDPTIGRSGTR